MAEFPEVLLSAAYPKGFVAYLPPGVTLEEIMNLVRTYPLRKTNVAAQSSSSGQRDVLLPDAGSAASGFHAMGQFIAGMLQGHSSCPVPKERDKPAEASMATCGLSRRSTPVLALMDGQTTEDREEPLQDLKTEAAEALSKRQSVAAEPTPVASQLDALRAGLYGDDGVSETKVQNRVRGRGRGRRRGRGRSQGRGRGRSAGRGRGRGRSQKLEQSSHVSKRPATARGSLLPGTKEAAPKKRPAASTVSTGGSPKATKAARNAALLAKVPAALKEKFKNGCPTCRYTPL